MEFNEARYKEQLERVLAHVRQVSTPSSDAQPASNFLAYDDKFTSADALGRSAVTSALDILKCLSLDDGLFARGSGSVMLRFEEEEHCVFACKRPTESKEVALHVQNGVFGAAQMTYVWHFTVKYSLKLILSNTERKELNFWSQESMTELTTRSEFAPRVQTRYIEGIDLDVSWLVHTAHTGFHIDRSVPLCRTPRRNPQVDEAVRFFSLAFKWAEKVCDYFASFTKTSISELQRKAHMLFVPVVSLSLDSSTTSTSPPVLFHADLLREHARELDQIRAKLLNLVVSSSSVSSPSSVCASSSSVSSSLPVFSSSASVYASLSSSAVPFPSSFASASLSASWEKFTELTNTISLLLVHLSHISQHFLDAVNFLEVLLYRQFKNVIGKEITPSDFDHLVNHRVAQLFKPMYVPQNFSYPVRKTTHDCEGFVEISREGSPISTFTSHSQPSSSCAHFDPEPGVTISCFGELFVHGYLHHQLGTQRPHCLNIRAKAYGCFLVLLGVMGEGGKFDAHFGMIVQDRNEISIPLDLEVLPSAREFKRATSSLSPEQERFAKMYRAMQLSSTLFGICIIQVKPLLERVLGLRKDSLLKEISLTQQLLTLFTRYEISSDLVRFDGVAEGTEDHDMVAAVQASVCAVERTIEELKQQETAEMWLPHVARKVAEESERENERAAIIA